MTFRIAVVQMTGRSLAGDENRARTVELAARAAAQGAQLVVLPELVISGYVLDRPGLLRIAEPIDGPTCAAWTDLARRTGLYIAGGLAEREGERLYNTAVLVGPEGVLLHYRKLHLFGHEKTVFTPGDRGLTTVDTAIGRIGLCVCYDLRFVEVLRALSLQGASIAAVPTAWVTGYDREPRDSGGFIHQARAAALQANLNQLVVACASQAGTQGDVAFLGSSLIADPYGNVLVGPLGDSEEIAIAAIARDASAKAQQRSPLVRPREDRRTDVYRLRLGDRDF